MDKSSWTPELDTEIQQLMDEYPAREVSRLTGRTVSAIYQRLRKLGYRKTVTRSDWTSEENDILAHLYPTTNNKALARQFGRSVAAIAQQARKLGAYKEIPETDLEDDGDEPVKAYSEDEIAPGHRVIRFGRAAPHNHGLSNRVLPRMVSSLGGF